MTRTYSRQVSKGDTFAYDVVCRVYDKSRLACMFYACFNQDYGLVSLNIVNVSLPNPSIGTEMQLFLARAYKVCSGMDNGLLEFALTDTF